MRPSASQTTSSSRATSEFRKSIEMQVYLIPIGNKRYELYCETDDGDGLSEEEERSTVMFRGLYVHFRSMLEEAQEFRRARRLAAVPADSTNRQSWLSSCRDWLISWVAEMVVEQRLLWHLRKQEKAALVHPDDLEGSLALEISLASLRCDVDRHRRWLIVDGILSVILGPLFFFVPGPNLIAYYFTFRAVAHFLSWRGARHGVEDVAWRTRASAPLAELRCVFSFDPDARAWSVQEVEKRLDLKHLASFVERMVVRLR